MTAAPVQDEVLDAEAARIIEAAIVRPGDALVVSFGPAVNRDQAARIVANMRETFGDAVKVVAVGGDVRLHVLRLSEVTP